MVKESATSGIKASVSKVVMGIVEKTHTLIWQDIELVAAKFLSSPEPAIGYQEAFRLS
jgi:hypothetical protein